MSPSAKISCYLNILSQANHFYHFDSSSGMNEEDARILAKKINQHLRYGDQGKKSVFQFTEVPGVSFIINIRHWLIVHYFSEKSPQTERVPLFVTDHAHSNLNLNYYRLYNNPMGTIVGFTSWQTQNIVLGI